MTLSNPNYLPKAPSPNPITLSGRVSTDQFWVHTNMQFIAGGYRDMMTKYDTCPQTGSYTRGDNAVKDIKGSTEKMRIQNGRLDKNINQF